MGLGFAVGTRGADHNRSSANEADLSGKTNRFQANPGDVRFAIESENRAALMDSLILCKFLRGVFADLFVESADMLTAITGVQLSADDLRQSADQIVLLKRLYNQREGWTHEEDTLPKRFLEEALSDGVSSGALLSEQRLRELVSAYYEARGLTMDGRVSSEAIDLGV
jgi:aldehyde:ferredoxin oxidoreductase